MCLFAGSYQRRRINHKFRSTVKTYWELCSSERRYDTDTIKFAFSMRGKYTALYADHILYVSLIFIVLYLYVLIYYVSILIYLAQFIFTIETWHCIFSFYFAFNFTFLVLVVNSKCNSNINKVYENRKSSSVT